MTDHIPIKPATVRSLIDILGKLQDYPALRHEARDIVKELGEMAAMAGDFEHRLSILGGELLEAVGTATGRPIDTTLTAATVKAAKVALGEVVPALGNVIDFAPKRAANVPPVVDLPPLSLVLMSDGRRLGEPLDVFVPPPIGYSIQLPPVHHAGEKLPRARRVRVLDGAGESVPAWMAEAAATGRNP